MKLSNTKIQYNENGSFIDVQDLVSCDVSYSTSGNRSNWKRSGTYVNDTLSIELNFLRGSNTLLDATSKSSEIEMRWNDGSTIYQGTFFIDNKFNTKEGTKTNTYMSLIFLPKLIDGTENTLKKTSTAQGAASGVQDVQIEGKSIVDEGTGIANITTLATKTELETAVDKATEAINSLNDYCDSLDATKQEVISFITLSGSSGTLTAAQIETLKSNTPRLNYIVRTNIVLKCVYYTANQGVYAAAGESKIHVIDAKLNTGAWTYTIYNMQPTLTSGTNIKTINGNSILGSGNITITGEPTAYLKSITKTEDGVVTIIDKDGNATTFQTGGGSGGGVSQTYVDTQDQAILATAEERIKEEGTERATMDATLSEAILNETDARSVADATLQTNIDNEIVARTKADTTLQSNIDTKLDKKTPGYKAVYAVSQAGDQLTFPFSENEATGATVAGRNINGQIYCENPTEAKHAVNYEYFWANIPESSTRFAVDKEHTSSKSWSREMTVYSTGKAAWLVLDCGGYTNDCAKALIFTDTKAYWGNDSFDYIDTNMIQWSWKDSTYRITYYPETHTFVVLTNNSVRRMMMIGI